MPEFYVSATLANGSRQGFAPVTAADPEAAARLCVGGDVGKLPKHHDLVTVVTEIGRMARTTFFVRRMARR